jgi:hypothetical protein
MTPEADAETEGVLDDLWRLMHGQSKHGMVWSAVLTLSFAGLAVAFLVDGAQDQGSSLRPE